MARLYGTPVPGRAGGTWALVSTQHWCAFPLRVEPVVRSDTEPAAPTAPAAAQTQQAAAPGKHRPGPPQGSQHTPKADSTRTPAGGRRPGHVGHHHARPRVPDSPRHLLAHLRCDAALACPDAGPYAGRGPRRKDGAQGEDDTLPLPSRTEPAAAGPMQTWVSQRPLRPQEGAPPWHGVRSAQTKLRPQARAHGILCRSAVALAYAPLLDEGVSQVWMRCEMHHINSWRLNT